MNDTGSGIKSNRPGVENGAGGNKAATGEEVSQLCGMIISQNNEAYINPNWVLLDSESTDHIFCNEKLLTDMKQQQMAIVLGCDPVGETYTLNRKESQGFLRSGITRNT